MVKLTINNKEVIEEYLKFKKECIDNGMIYTDEIINLFIGYLFFLFHFINSSINIIKVNNTIENINIIIVCLVSGFILLL